jgi:hypothetical protein
MHAAPIFCSHIRLKVNAVIVGKKEREVNKASASAGARMPNAGARMPNAGARCNIP